VGDFDGRVAFITGGGSGIGAGCARRLAGDGATVVLADIDGDAAKRVAAEIGGAASAVVLDVRDPAAVDQVVRGVQRTHGRLDVALNIAGIGGPQDLPADTSPEGWRQVMAINLDGVFYCMRAELELMVPAGTGSIINMASIYGLVGTGTSVAYAAAKHGVVGMTRSAGLAYAGSGVRVNAVAPAVIDTPLVSGADPDIVAGIVAQHPMGRIGQVPEVAEMVAFLASDRASYCTGAVYPVDGAFTAG